MYKLFAGVACTAKDGPLTTAWLSGEVSAGQLAFDRSGGDNNSEALRGLGSSDLT